MTAEQQHQSSHQRNGVSVKSVLWCGAGLAGFLLVTLGVGWFMYIGIRTSRTETSRFPVVSKQAPPEFDQVPKPHLQLAPDSDYRSYRARELKRLSTYGWSSYKTGAARIPIERAMRLLSERLQTTPTGSSRLSDSAPR